MTDLIPLVAEDDLDRAVDDAALILDTVLDERPVEFDEDAYGYEVQP